MGSPPLRLIALLAAASLAGVAAAPAHADEQGARHTAEAFLQALRMSNSTAACALLTPQALATAGGTAECEKAYGPQDESPDYEAYGHLQQALRAAEKSAVKRRGQFVNKRFTVAKLAREMEKIDEELTVKVGQGPGAARSARDDCRPRSPLERASCRALRGGGRRLDLAPQQRHAR